MGKLIAKVRVVVGVLSTAGVVERKEFAPGEEVKGLNDHDRRELVGCGAVLDEAAELAAERGLEAAREKAAAEFDAARKEVVAARESTAPVAAAKPSDGMTVAQLKAALEAKEIAVPEGTTLKADLAALLDGAPTPAA